MCGGIGSQAGKNEGNFRPPSEKGNCGGHGQCGHRRPEERVRVRVKAMQSHAVRVCSGCVDHSYEKNTPRLGNERLPGRRV